MDPADIFELALQGLTAKDDSPSVPVTEQVSPDSAIVADAKPAELDNNEEQGGIDIIETALRSAGITSTSSSTDTSQQVLPMTQPHVIKVIGRSGNQITVPTVANSHTRLPGGGGQLIKISRIPGSPSILRKRPNAEPSNYPIKFIRHSNVNGGPVRIESMSDMKFRSQTLGPQRIPMNYPLNFLSQRVRIFRFSSFISV